MKEYAFLFLLVTLLLVTTPASTQIVENQTVVDRFPAVKPNLWYFYNGTSNGSTMLSVVYLTRTMNVTVLEVLNDTIRTWVNVEFYYNGTFSHNVSYVNNWNFTIIERMWFDVFFDVTDWNKTIDAFLRQNFSLNNESEVFISYLNYTWCNKTIRVVNVTTVIPEQLGTRISKNLISLDYGLFIERYDLIPIPEPKPPQPPSSNDTNYTMLATTRSLVESVMRLTATNNPDLLPQEEEEETPGQPPANETTPPTEVRESEEPKWLIYALSILLTLTVAIIWITAYTRLREKR